MNDLCKTNGELCACDSSLVADICHAKLCVVVVVVAVAVAVIVTKYSDSQFWALL